MHYYEKQLISKTSVYSRKKQCCLTNVSIFRFSMWNIDSYTLTFLNRVITYCESRTEVNRLYYYTYVCDIDIDINIHHIIVY